MPTHVFNRAACSRPGSVTASSAAPHCSMTTAWSDLRTSNRAFASVASSSSRMPTPRPWSGWGVRLVRRRRRPRRSSGRTARNGSPSRRWCAGCRPGRPCGGFPRPGACQAAGRSARRSPQPSPSGDRRRAGGCGRCRARDSRGGCGGSRSCRCPDPAWVPAAGLERSLDGGPGLAFVGVDPGEWVHLRRANGETVEGRTARPSSRSRPAGVCVSPDAALSCRLSVVRVAI
jgi:hypothetical protein